MPITFDFSPLMRRRENERAFERSMALTEKQSELTEQRQARTDERALKAEILPRLAAHAVNVLRSGDTVAGNAAVAEFMRAAEGAGLRGESPTTMAARAAGPLPKPRTLTAQEVQDNRTIELLQMQKAGTLSANDAVELEYRTQAKTVDERDRKRMLDIEDVILQNQRGRGRAPTQRELSEHKAIKDRMQSRLNIMNLLMGGLLGQAPEVAGALTSSVPVGSVQVGVEDATGKKLYRTPRGDLILEDGTAVPSQ